MTTPIYATGVKKTVAIALESTFGVQATATAQLLRRVTSSINANVQVIESQEILPSQQVRDSRQGPRQIQGTLSGQLSPASYSMILAQLLRGTWTNGVTTATLSDTVATLSGSNLVITGASEHFMTGTGFKLGDVVRISGLSGGPSAQNAENLRIINLTDTVMTLAPPKLTPTLWSSGQSATIAVVGQKLITPVSGQSDQSFTIEHWYNDIGYSELYTGCKFTQITFTIPASGFVTFQAQLIGQQQTVGSTQQYPSATAASSTTGLTSTGGLLVYQGVPEGAVTSLNLQIIADAQADPVVGTNFVPAIFMGTLRVSGSLSALMNNDSKDSDFLNEVETQMSVLMTTNPTANADFVSMYLPRMKLSTATKQDSDKAIVRSYNLMGLEQDNGGAGTNWDDTSITLQDSIL